MAVTQNYSARGEQRFNGCKLVRGGKLNDNYGPPNAGCAV
jgi:hypothetical protein